MHDELDATAADYPTFPTTIDGDMVERPRPWVQRIGGVANLPPNVEIADALRCLLPQGIRGCGFVQPLESMYKAIDRTVTPEDDAYGFMEGGLSAVVFLSDSVDCSYHPEAEVIFSPDGSRVFWSLPDEQRIPTAAVCWNAGVQCSGLSDGFYDKCHAEQLDPQDGTPITPGETSALFPLERYLDILPAGARVYGIVGVPVGYPRMPLRYEAPPASSPFDPDFGTNHGVGPGCVSELLQAAPPVRIRELVEDRNPAGALYSMCDLASYEQALASIAADLVDAL